MLVGTHNFPTTFCNLEARTLARILYTLPAKLMGLRFLMSFAPTTLGIKLPKVALDFSQKHLYYESHQKSHDIPLYNTPTMLKKCYIQSFKQSGPRALSLPNSVMAFHNLSFVKTFSRSLASSRLIEAKGIPSRKGL